MYLCYNCYTIKEVNMKEIKAKYLLVDSENISKKNYILRQVFDGRTTSDVYVSHGRKTMNDFFQDNDIPTQYRKLIIKIEQMPILKNRAFEYTLDIPFDFDNALIYDTIYGKKIDINSYSFTLPDAPYAEEINCMTDYQFVPYSDIKAFMQEVVQSGLLVGYLYSIKQFFEIDRDLALSCERFDDDKERTSVFSFYINKGNRKKNFK